MIGNIKNETTTPQVELLFRKRFLDLTTGFYWDRQGLYAPSEGSGVQPYYRGCCGTSSDGGCSVTWDSDFVRHDSCPEGQTCQYNTGICFPPEPGELGGTGVEGCGYQCGDSISVVDPFNENPHVSSGSKPGTNSLHPSTVDGRWQIDDIHYEISWSSLSSDDRIELGDGIAGVLLGVLIGLCGFRFVGEKSAFLLISLTGGSSIYGGTKAAQRIENLANKYMVPVYDYTLECGI